MSACSTEQHAACAGPLLRLILIEVIDGDKIEIGRGRHSSPPSLPKPKMAMRPFFTVPWSASNASVAASSAMRSSASAMAE